MIKLEICYPEDDSEIIVKDSEDNKKCMNTI